jgi:hypothetical protein
MTRQMIAHQMTQKSHERSRRPAARQAATVDEGTSVSLFRLRCRLNAPSENVPARGFDGATIFFRRELEVTPVPRNPPASIKLRRIMAGSGSEGF